MSIQNVPFVQNLYFTGRDDVLAQLRTTFLRGRKPIQPQVISGLSGIGKTQTALEYAYRYGEHYTSIFWVRADTQDLLITDLAAIGKLLDVPAGDEQDKQLTVAVVKHWLQTREGWLLILDNANDLGSVERFLPLGSGHILLTAREPAIGAHMGGLELDFLRGEEGALFLLHRSKLLPLDEPLTAASEANRSAALAIVDALGGLPLALTQAAAYIEETRCGLAGYRARYQQRPRRLLEAPRGLTSEHPNPVTTTWSLSFERVAQASAAAADLLRLCAFLHPDAIPEEIITQGAAELGPALATIATDLFALDDAIVELRKYSLIRRDPETKTLSIHRLVQAVIIDEMAQDTQQQWAARVVRAVQCAFPETGKHEQWPQCERLLPHVHVCADLITQWHMVFPEAASLLNAAGDYVCERGQYSKAEVLLTHALTMREQLLEPNHPDVAQSLNNLAELYRLQGKYTQALSLHQRALTIRQQRLGPAHPDVATSLNNLGRTYHHQASYKDAEVLYLQSFAMREQLLAPTHPDLAHSLNDLAGVYSEQGRYGEAEEFYQRALKIHEQVLGGEHPNTATSLNNLAGVYSEQGRYGEAEKLYQRALKIREQVLGSEHPDTASSLNNLAVLYHSKRNFSAAETHYQRALAIHERVLGSGYPHTLLVMKNYATLLQQANKRRKANAMLQRIAEIEQADEKTREHNPE